MINTQDILQTIKMIREENLDIRTVTMGISLFDCITDDPARLEAKIYDKITTKAKDLVRVCEEFIMGELERARQLGVTIMQIDDGWQSGITANSGRATGGVWEGYYAYNNDFWKVDPKRFPHGLDLKGCRHADPIDHHDRAGTGNGAFAHHTLAIDGNGFRPCCI